MTSEWARWPLKLPASRLFTQPLVQVQIKQYIKAPCHWPLWEEFNGEFPKQKTSNAEYVSNWWRDYEIELELLKDIPKRTSWVVSTGRRKLGTDSIYMSSCQHRESNDKDKTVSRRSHDCLIFILDIPVPGKPIFTMRQGPDRVITGSNCHYVAISLHMFETIHDCICMHILYCIFLPATTNHPHPGCVSAMFPTPPSHLGRSPVSPIIVGNRRTILMTLHLNECECTSS